MKPSFRPARWPPPAAWPRKRPLPRRPHSAARFCSVPAVSEKSGPNAMRHGAGFVIAELDPAVNPPARCASRFAKSMARGASPLVTTGQFPRRLPLSSSEPRISAAPYRRNSNRRRRRRAQAADVRDGQRQQQGGDQRRPVHRCDADPERVGRAHRYASTVEATRAVTPGRGRRGSRRAQPTMTATGNATLVSSPTRFMV